MRRVAGFVLVALLATISLVRAGERTHTVAPGESASSIAKRYYGDFGLAELLLRYNEKAGTTIRPGEQLRVPYCEVHRVKAGDSWSALAKRYAGRTSAYPIVAELNGRVPERPLQVGEEIVFPVILRQRLERGDTLASLAQRYFPGMDRTKLLQELNRLDDPRRLSVGQPIEIPLMRFRLREVAPPPAPKKPEPVVAKKEEVEKPEPVKEPEPVVEPEPRFAKELREAFDAFDAGEFDRAQELLDAFGERITKDGSPAEQTEYWRLQSFVHVAFDRWDEACTASRSIPEGFSSEPLDPALISPKIREALSRCDRL